MSGLTSLTLSMEKLNIEEHVFYGCKDLETITFLEGSTTLPDGLFAGSTV